MVFVEFMSEGDISIAGLPGVDIITYSNNTLTTCNTGIEEPDIAHSSRSCVWNSLRLRYPELKYANCRYHTDNNGVTWAEYGPVASEDH